MNLFVLVSVMCVVGTYDLVTVDKSKCIAMVRDTFADKEQCLQEHRKLTRKVTLVNRVEKKMIIVEKQEPGACIEMASPVLSREIKETK